MAKRKRNTERQYMTLSEARLYMAEWAAKENAAEAAHQAALAERKLQSYRHGGRKGLRVSRAMLDRAVNGVRDGLRRQLRTEPKPGAVYKEVGKQFGRSASWVRQQLKKE